MSLKFVVAHCVDSNNVGDIASNPLQYFLKEDEYQVVNITDLYRANYPAGLPIVVGGGGLLGNEFFGDVVRSVLNSADKNQLMHLWEDRWQLLDPANTEAHEQFLVEYQELLKKYMNKVERNSTPRVVWGAGWNADYSKKSKSTFTYPNWLSEFDLVGVRDWKQNINWAPCASCMHPALRKKYAIKNDIIWFEHKKQLIRDFGSESIPRFINSGSNVEQTIELLGSANTILTNSYHGAYWGTLLKKKVIVVGAWGAKFYAMRHQPRILDKTETWQSVIEETPIYQTAIDECANTTLEFWNKVNTLR